MTAALSAVAGVALVVALVAVVWGRSLSARVVRASTRNRTLEAELAALRRTKETLDEQLNESEHRLFEARGRADQSAFELGQAERRADEAGRRAEQAEDRAEEAEARASQAEQRADQALKRAEEAERAASGSDHLLDGTDRPEHAVTASDRSDPSLEALVRLRLEREWAEVAGPSAPLPTPWDGSLEAALTAELEVIREVTGTPGRLDIRGAGPEQEPDWRLAALSAELLRTVARVADEMAVTSCGGPFPSVEVQVASPGTDPPDLDSVVETATSMGVRVEVEPTDDGFMLRLAAL